MQSRVSGAAVGPELDLMLSMLAFGFVKKLRLGVECIRHRRDDAQAKRLERWLKQVTMTYAESILPFDEETAHVWGRLRVPNRENPLDKQIAATALIHDLTVVTRNTGHYAPTGARLLNPFVVGLSPGVAKPRGIPSCCTAPVDGVTS